MTMNPRVTTILNNPARFTFSETLRSGETILFRPLQKEDAARLGNYFVALSDDTRSRFAPHAFTHEKAEELCSQVGEGDTLRLIALRTASDEVIAYYLLEFAIPEGDVERYRGHGIAVDGSSDCRFAPSVIDHYQHSGVGSALIWFCQTMARAVGCERMILMGGVYTWNDKAVPYYEKFGFRKAGMYRIGTPKETLDMLLDLPPHQQFLGQLFARDCKRHIPHTFTVPPGCTEINIRLHFEPLRVQGRKNMICLTLFDPNGFRGAGHRGGNHHAVKMNAHSATPGYLAGALPAGEWTVQLDTHMIMPGAPVRYQLSISYSEVEALKESDIAVEPHDDETSKPAVPHNPASGWYRGDLHSHTDHSDGSRSVAELIQTARDYQLDFIFLTDHNTVSHLVEMEKYASDDLLLAGGLELTTFFGHALCLGTREWVDWRVTPGNPRMAEIATQRYGLDQLFIIAHPEAIGDPSCTGCRWRYGEMMPGTSQIVEIWNGPWGDDSNNEQALSLWYDWLNQGRRMVATAGTDTHGSGDYAKNPGFNVIYAEELSEEALLKAIRAGHLYLSSGPRLTLTAHSEDGTAWMMGDQLDCPVTLVAEWENCPKDAVLRVIANGRLQTSQATGERGNLAWQATPEQASWVLLEVRAGVGGVLAITNPIFLTYRASR